MQPSQLDSKFTISQIRYLFAIRRLSTGDSGVRPSEIAGLLGVKRPSVTGMLDVLYSMDLVFRKSNGATYFTEAGQAVADILWQDAAIISAKLQHALQLSADTADASSLLLLDVMSTSSVLTKYMRTERILSEHEPYDTNSSLLIYHDLISAIVAAMEARDSYTASHSRRVSDMSETICHLLGLQGELTEKIHIAADLHDIGKLGIADSVLMREGPLSENEWRCMKRHPSIGYDILSKVASFQEIAYLVRHHHERWDGRGYPDGIAGQGIPLGSRIIAVADSIDAMMSHRLYRQRMSPEACQYELTRNCGTMYDSVIVESVLAQWDLLMKARELSSANALS